MPFEKKLNVTSAEFMEWKANHTQCQANYTGSAGGMAAVGLYRMFERAERSRQLKYVDFYRDGDSKSHAAAKAQIACGNCSRTRRQRKANRRSHRPAAELLRYCHQSECGRPARNEASNISKPVPLQFKR